MRKRIFLVFRKIKIFMKKLAKQSFVFFSLPE